MEISLVGKRIRVPKVVNDWLEFDRAFSAKVMAGGWTKMTRKELGYAETQLLVLAVALTACGTIIKGQDRPIEVPTAAQPQIAYFTKDMIKGPTLVSQLAGVQGLSGKGAGCNPAIVMVEGGNAGGETAGFCTTDNVITNVVVRGERNSTQQTVNEDLITRKHIGPDGKPDIAYVEYGSGNKKGTLFTYVYATKITTWHFPNGGIVEFPAAQGPFEELIGKLLEPGGVAQAAEIDTPTPTATVTATATLPATPTKEAPTSVPATEVVHTVFDSAPFDNIGADSWKRFVNSDVVETKDITPGLILQGTGIQHLTLVDYELNVEDNQTPMWVILGFTVVDKGIAYNYAFKTTYNPCPGGTVKLYPRRNSVLVKDAPYVVNAYTVKSVYDSVLTIDTLGIGVGCDLIPELSPTDLYSLKDYFLGKDKGKAGTLLDLSSILYLGALQEIK